MSRFSLTWLFATVGYVALVCAAFASPTSFIGSLFKWVTNLLMLVALVAPLYRTGEKRAFWLGFAIFAWGWVVFDFLKISSYLTPNLITHIHSRVLMKSPDSIGQYWAVGSAVEIMFVALIGAFVARYLWRTRRENADPNLKTR
jgi:hypothetical protein